MLTLWAAVVAERLGAPLFFGRSNETQALVERLKATNLVMVIPSLSRSSLCGSGEGPPLARK